MAATLPHLTRRKTIASLVAGAALATPFLPGAPSALAKPAHLPRRRVLSVNMRSSEQQVVPVPQTVTYTSTLPIETGATAMRIGLGNTTPHRFTLGGVAIVEADGWPAQPGDGWAYFSFSGDESDSVHPPATGPQTVTVGGDSGNYNVPRITWSDWIDFRTTAPAGRRPQLIFRTLVPAQELVLMSAPNVNGMVSTPGEPARFAAQAAVQGDYLTDLTAPLPAAAPSKLSPLYVVQYRAAVPGLQMVIGGDSHLAMIHTFAVLAADKLSTPAAPISVWNTAWGGKPSNTFWPALQQAIADGHPSLTVIQGWTANDGMNPTADEAYLNRVKRSAADTFAAGGLPVIVKALPRDLFGKPELATWQAINQQLDSLVPGALVFDPGPYLYNPAMPGNYIAGLSGDDIHPNLAGNLSLRDPFIRLISPFLG